MILKLLVLFIITTVIKSETHKKDDKLVDYFAPAKYTFSYGVEDFKTGDYKMHNEERNGDSVKGEYSVVDPDGSIRTVSYTVDKEHGYQAVVKQSEPLIVSTELKESQRINTQNKLSTKSSEHNPDFNGEAFSKQTPINLVNSTENAHGNDKDNFKKEEINQYLQNYQSYISKLQNNRQENIKLNTKPKNKQQIKYLDSMKFPNFKTNDFQLNHKESKKVNLKEVTKVNQLEQTDISNYSGFPNYKSSAMEPLHYTPELFKISKQKIGGGLYKSDVNVQENYQTGSDNIPADLHGNYGQKLNVVQQSAFPNQKVDVKQKTQKQFYTNQDYFVNGNKNYQELFHQPHGFNVKNQYGLREVEIQYPKFSYKSIENGKSQENLKVSQNMKDDHLSQVLDGEHNYYNQEEYNPVISYLPVSNGNDKYNQDYKNDREEKNENLKIDQVQQFYVPITQIEENVKIDDGDLTNFEEQLYGKTLAEYYGNLQKQGTVETQNEEYLNGDTLAEHNDDFQKQRGTEMFKNITPKTQRNKNIKGYLNDETLATHYGNLQKQGEIKVVNDKKQRIQPKENTEEYLNGLEYFGNLHKQAGNKIIEHQFSQPKEQYQISKTYFAENDYKPQYFHQIKSYPRFQFEKIAKL